MNKMIQRLLAGAASGTAATLPMTAVMLAWHRQLPWSKRDPVPPAQITKHFTEAIGLDDELGHEGRLALTVPAHFGYGASVGALYGAVARPQSAAQAAASGMVYGLGVWAASYAGWLPVAGLYRPAKHEPAERHAMMIASHLVYGAALGVLVHALTKRRRPEHKPPAARYGRRVRRRLQAARST
jgi:hypothetical protein